jgi:hypothetical protein
MKKREKRMKKEKGIKHPGVRVFIGAEACFIEDKMRSFFFFS